MLPPVAAPHPRKRPETRRQPSPGRPRRRLPERLLAWVLTGPVGHLAAFAADLAALLGAGLAAAVRRRAGRGRG